MRLESNQSFHFNSRRDDARAREKDSLSNSGLNWVILFHFNKPGGSEKQSLSHLEKDGERRESRGCPRKVARDSTVDTNEV